MTWMRNLVMVVVVLLIVLAFAFYSLHRSTLRTVNTSSAPPLPTKQLPQNPLMIPQMRARSYPGSDLKIEQTLADGSNYHQYIASYQSDDLKIYGLLTVPMGQKPSTGWPVIIFNHGYIPPTQYRTTERYVAYVDAFARDSYIVFKSDYRGNGSSEGNPDGAYYSPAYTIDVLNALTTLKHYKDADPNRIGMWGHSMGGNITLRSLVVDPQDIKVAVIWGGVVGTYSDLVYNWQRNVSYQPPPNEMTLRNRFRQNLIQQYSSPSVSSPFWSSIDPNSYLSDITAPIQLDAGGSDEEVPVAFSQGLYQRLKGLNKNVQIYIYPGSDHNISQSFNEAMTNSVNFMDKYLK